MKKAKVQEQQGKEPIYNPAAQYKWSQDEQFTFNGKEFGIMYNNISQFLTQPLTPVLIMKISDAFTILQGALTDKVNNGIIKPVESEAVVN